VAVSVVVSTAVAAVMAAAVSVAAEAATVVAEATGNGCTSGNADAMARQGTLWDESQTRGSSDPLFLFALVPGFFHSEDAGRAASSPNSDPRQSS
jgi:hypothetical protein